jgi:hypothetical protein
MDGHLQEEAETLDELLGPPGRLPSLAGQVHRVAHHHGGGSVLPHQSGHPLQVLRGAGHADRPDWHRYRPVGIGDGHPNPDLTEIETEDPAERAIRGGHRLRGP